MFQLSCQKGFSSRSKDLKEAGKPRTSRFWLYAYLRRQGRQVPVDAGTGRHPKSWPAGIRQILLEWSGDGLSSMAELFLYEADRAQHVHETLEPALRTGTIVLCDRYTDSTLAYQGYGRGWTRQSDPGVKTRIASWLMA